MQRQASRRHSVLARQNTADLIVVLKPISKSPSLGHPTTLDETTRQKHCTLKHRAGCGPMAPWPVLARLRLKARLIRQCPSVALVPLAALLITVALGVFGVLKGKQQAEEQSRNIAKKNAENARQALDNMVARAVLPMAQMAQLVKKHPAKEDLLKFWAVAAPSWWLGTVTGTVSFALAPHAYYVESLWYSEADPDEIPEASFQKEGWNPDLLDNATSAASGTQQILEGRRRVIIGPIHSASDALQSYFVLLQPIFVPNVTHHNETWGHTVKTACRWGACWDAATGTKFFGFASLAIDLRWLLHGEDGPLGGLRRKSYKHQLWCPPYPPSANPKAAKVPVHALKGRSLHEPSNTVSIQFPVVDKTWELHIWKADEEHGWMVPLVAVVVMGGLLMCSLLFSTLLSRAEHQELLHSLLPDETIKRMRHEGRWALRDDAHMIQTMHLETPAEHMLRIIEGTLTQQAVPIPLLLGVKEALQRSADVYQPSEQQMKEQMKARGNMDDDVRRALAAQLLGSGDSRGGSFAAALDSIPTTPDSFKQHVPLHSDAQLVALPSKQPEESGKCVRPLATNDDGHWCIQSKPLKDGNNQDTIMTRAAACSSISSSFCEEAATQLATWLLQAPAVSNLIKQATNQAISPGDAAREPAQLVPEQADDDVVVTVMKPILTHLERVLMTTNDWDFDVYALEEASHGRPLSCLGFWLLQSSGLKSWAHMSTKKLVVFLDVVEAGYYLDNPYHNRRHAADVLQSVHVIMHRAGLLQGYADKLTQLGCYLAAMIHDFEHVGCTNDYLVNSSDTLAVRYNDRSPLENHHLAGAWALLKTKQCDILRGLPRSEVSKLRKFIIDLVLGTDMKQHFAILGQFETLSRQAGSDQSSHGGLAASRMSSASSRAPSTSTLISERQPLNEQDRLVTLQMMLKCADLGHSAAPLPEHLKWVSALEAEFFLQGDKEKELGLPVSPLCDRTREGVMKSQIGFFDFVVLPLFKTFSQRFAISTLYGAVLINMEHWKSVVPRTSSHHVQVHENSCRQQT